jgi:hypothetical protein
MIKTYNKILLESANKILKKEISDSLNDILTERYLLELHPLVSGSAFIAGAGIGRIIQAFTKCIKHCDPHWYLKVGATASLVTLGLPSFAVGGIAGGVGTFHHMLGRWYRKACIIQCKIQYYNLKIKRSISLKKDTKKLKEKLKKWEMKKKKFIEQSKKFMLMFKEKGKIKYSERIKDAVSKGFGVKIY